MREILTVAPLYLFPMLLLCAALWDLLTLQIPNWISLAVFGSFLAFSALAPLGLTEVLSHLGLGAAVLIAGILLFVRGHVGGGDVKLLAAAAVWVGWAQFPLYLAATALSGGVLALLLLAFRRLKLPPSWAPVDWLKRLHSPGAGLPYGIAIAIGGVLVFRHLPLP